MSSKSENQSERTVTRRGVIKGIGTATALTVAGTGSVAAISLSSVTVSDETLDAWSTDDESTYDYIVNPDGSEDYETIQGVVDAIASNSTGQKVLVRSGTYAEVELPDTFGSTDDPHIFHAEEDGVTIDGDGIPALIVNGTGVVDFRGFTFVGSSNDLVLAQNQTSSSTATIFFEYCDFSYAYENGITAIDASDYEPFGFDVGECWWGSTKASDIGPLIDVRNADSSNVDPVLSGEGGGGGGGALLGGDGTSGLLALLGAGGIGWWIFKDD